MKKYLVIGNPIEHSLSPKLHNYWFKKNKINAVYEKKQLSENNIKIYNTESGQYFLENIYKKILKDEKISNNEVGLVIELIKIGYTTSISH